MDTQFTQSGVRMRLHSTRAGTLNWLLLPGGPGIGSESLQELADSMDVPGSIWLVDLPGDGSNLADESNPYASWPQVLVEAADAVSDPIYVGHSTGGMYLLATPSLSGRLRGLVLVDTAPNYGWHAEYVEMTRNNPLPAFDRAVAAYSRQKTVANLASLAVASAEWNFTAKGLNAGRKLLARMPYNSEAVEWSDLNFDQLYNALWWPLDIPVLRLWGQMDKIVSQKGWNDSAYHTPNVMTREIDGAGHFPWIENPSAVRDALSAFSSKVLASLTAELP